MPPLTVTYCHCADCRRATGAPVAAFAAFRDEDLEVTGPLADAAGPTAEARRQFCSACGIPVVARYGYLPGQVYVALGCLDQAASLPPARHSHHDARLPWLALHDDLPKAAGSGRAALTKAGD